MIARANAFYSLDRASLVVNVEKVKDASKLCVCVRLKNGADFDTFRLMIWAD